MRGGFIPRALQTFQSGSHKYSMGTFLALRKYHQGHRSLFVSLYFLLEGSVDPGLVKCMYHSLLIDFILVASDEPGGKYNRTININAQHKVRIIIAITK